MDWINCNSCCAQPGDQQNVMFKLSSCGHIFCDHCLPKDTIDKKCPVCSNRCQYIKLSSKMTPDAQMFFKEPGEFLKQMSTQGLKLLDFQKEHRTRLVSYHRKLAAEHKDIKRQLEAAKLKIEEIERENRRLKEALRNNQMTGHYATPNVSYRQVVTNSRMSPQISPIQRLSSSNFISPGRLTLSKNPAEIVSPRDPLSQMSQNVPRMTPPHLSRNYPSGLTTPKTFQPAGSWRQSDGYQSDSTAFKYNLPRRQFPQF